MKARVSVGRQRITRVVGPTEAHYVMSVRQSVKQIRDTILALTKHIENITPEAMMYGLRPVYDEAIRLTPKATHKLVNSAFLEIVNTKNGGTVALGFAKGNNPHYAIYVHEIPNQHAGDTQWKFLEEAVNRKIHLLLPRVVEYLRQQTGVTP